MPLAGNTEHLEGIKNAPVERRRDKWQYNIKVDLREQGLGGVNCD
jgi:hypothetical protein